MPSRISINIMARFEKTRLNVISAVLILLGLYALGGLAYAAWIHSADSALIWTVVAAVAFGASFAYQRYVTIKKRRAP